MAAHARAASRARGMPGSSADARGSATTAPCSSDSTAIEIQKGGIALQHTHMPATRRSDPRRTPAREPDPRGPGQRRRARLYQLGALLAAAAATAAVLIAILTSGSTSQLAPGKPVPGAARTLALFAGIPQRGIALGDPHAPASLVEFGDLQCPACAQFATDALPAVIDRYVRSGRIRLEFRALDFIGADSRRAASMVLALAAQNHLWEFAELAYRNQGLENSGYVTDTYLRALASAIPGVDLTRALAARDSPAVRVQLDEARALARRAHVSATPSFELTRAGQAPRRLAPTGLDRDSFAAALERLLAGG
jgi:protein-disulfide isomerase